MGILTDPTRYSADRGRKPFVIPTRLPLYDSTIADDATTVVRVCAEAAHKSRLDEFASFDMAERSAAKFLWESVEEVWFNNLKDVDAFCTKLSALEIITFLNANSGGIHGSLLTGLTSYVH